MTKLFQVGKEGTESNFRKMKHAQFKFLAFFIKTVETLFKPMPKSRLGFTPKFMLSKASNASYLKI